MKQETHCKHGPLSSLCDQTVPNIYAAAEHSKHGAGSKKSTMVLNLVCACSAE